MTSTESKGRPHGEEDNSNTYIQQNLLQILKVKADSPIKKWEGEQIGLEGVNGEGLQCFQQ